MYYYHLMFTSFWIFFFEMILLCLSRKDYMWSFNFWMDFLSTFSTLLEIPYVLEIFGVNLTGGTGATKLAKTGKVSRVSSKASKAIRVVRLIRLVRIARLYR
jgi:hypothetical protein